MKKFTCIILALMLMLSLSTVSYALSPPYVSSVSIQGSAERTVLIGDEIELTASIESEGVSSAYVLWETDNTDVLSVDGGDLSVTGDPPQSIAKVTALAAGTATVTIYASTSMNPCNSDESAEVTIHVLDPETYQNDSVVIENTWRVNITDSSVPETVTVNGTLYLDTEEADAAKYLGYAVHLTLDGDTVIGVTPDEIKNDVVKIDCRNVSGSQDGALYYYQNPDTDKYPTPILLAEDAVLLINNRTATPEEFAEIESGNVTAISNDGNTENGYEFLLANSYTNQMVISHAPIGAIEGFEACPTTTQTYYDLTEEGVKNIFYVDGVRSFFPNVNYTENGKSFLPSGVGVMSTVSVIGDDTPLRIFYVSNRMESGTVTRITYTDNSDYTIDSSFKLKAEDGVILYVGSEREYFLNVDGKIVFAVPMYQSIYYHVGYLLDQDVSTSFGKNRIQLLFIDDNGQETINELSYELYFGVGTHGSKKTSLENFTEFPLEQGIFFYRLSNSTDKILDVVIPGEKLTDYHCLGTNLTGTYDATNNRILLSSDDVLYFFPDSPAFFIADENNLEAAHGARLIKDAFHDGETITGFSVYGYVSFPDEPAYQEGGCLAVPDSRFVVPECIVLHDGTKLTSTEAPESTETPTDPTHPPYNLPSDDVVIVTGISVTKFGDETGYVIEGFQGGKSVTFNVCDTQEACDGYALITGNKLHKGDVIMVAKGKNYLTTISQITDSTALKLGSTPGWDNYQGFSYEDYTGIVTARTINDVTFKDGTEKNLRGARFTLVNMTGTYTAINATSIGYINTGNTQGYKYIVYVRTYDDDPVDVVIYEFRGEEDVLPIAWTNGDANRDGVVNAKDITTLRRAIASGNGGIDFNGDGEINAKDITLLRRAISNGEF